MTADQIGRLMDHWESARGWLFSAEVCMILAIAFGAGWLAFLVWLP